MRIGIDAREICGQPTGVGRYLSGLLAEWSRLPGTRRHQFVLYLPEPAGVDEAFEVRVLPGTAGTWWEQVQLPAAAARDRLDVFFAPAYSAPLRLAVPWVVAIHDVSFAAHPEWFHLREGMRRRWLARRSAAGARALVTISEFSRAEIERHLGPAGVPIHVIPPGLDAPDGATAPRAADPRVLYVGTLFNRRHLPDLVRAFAPIARRHPAARLDIVGRDLTYPREDLGHVIADSGVDGRVAWHPYVSRTELEQLYRAARVFAFLSEYEGLGLTPLEALARGVPPLLLDTPVARESCGDAAVYVPCGDVAAATAALERLMVDDGARQAVLGAAPAVLARYDWTGAAARTLAVLEAAGEGGSA